MQKKLVRLLTTVRSVHHSKAVIVYLMKSDYNHNISNSDSKRRLIRSKVHGHNSGDSTLDF